MNKTNPSIKCSVEGCKHHAHNHCTLGEITVGCSSTNASCCASTECDSFQAGNNCK